jgi:hypothetical protein
LEAELERRGSALGRADALIKDAAKQQPRAWDRVGRSLGLSGSHAINQTLSRWATANAQQPNPIHTSEIGNVNHGTLPHVAAPMSEGNPYLRANSLTELLAWDDVDFVRCAYVTILGRQPDAEGESYYTDRIRRGHSKMEVLWQLRRSPEGPSHDPGIAGFDRALKKAAWERKQWVGSLIRAVSKGEGNSSAWKRHRVLLNALSVIRSEQARQAKAIRGVHEQVSALTVERGPSPLSVAPAPPPAKLEREERPGQIATPSPKPSPDLDSRARYALQLLQIEEEFA